MLEMIEDFTGFHNLFDKYCISKNLTTVYTVYLQNCKMTGNITLLVASIYYLQFCLSKTCQHDLDL